MSFTEADPEDALPLLRAGELDLVLGFSYAATRTQDGRDVATVPLLHDPSHVILPATHPAAAGNGPVALEALADETWVAGCVRCRRHLLHLAAGAGSSPGSTSRPTTTSRSSR